MTAVDEAIAFLRQRLDEIEKERSDIQKALTALGEPVPSTQTISPTSIRSSEEVGTPTATTHTRSVRSLVESLLAEEDRAWNGSDIVKVFDSRGVTYTVTNINQSVRTAMWKLRESGTAFATDAGTIHAKWHKAEGPADMAGPVDQKGASDGATVVPERDI